MSQWTTQLNPTDQENVVTEPPEPPRYSSHGLDTHVTRDTAESPHSHSPAPAAHLTPLNDDRLNHSYSPTPLITPEPVQPPPPFLRRTLTRLPTYRSAILPPYSRRGADKYAALRDLEAQGYMTERPRCLQQGGRIWCVVVLVIVVIVIGIVVAVTTAAEKPA